MSDLIKQIEELNLRCDSSTLLPVILQVEQLLKERDEARRDVCYAEVNGQYGRRYKPQDIAKIKNWDCFTKDKTP